MFVSKKRLVGWVVVGFLAWMATAGARMTEPPKGVDLPPGLYKVAATPNSQQCAHKVGRLWFTITNYGFFGSQNSGTLRDCITNQVGMPSAEFPGGSKVEYLFQGAFWIGAIVNGDTMLSIGNDGWLDVKDLWPDEGAKGAIVRRSTNPGSPYFSPDAVSDLDFVAVLTDTLTDPQFASGDPADGPHRPMGLKVIQNSYSWATGWGQDWIMLDFKILNIGRRPLSNIYLGVFADPDVGHPNTPNYFTDDLSGFKLSVPNDLVPTCPDTINLAYVQDQDGDPVGGGFTNTSTTAATGIRVVNVPGGLSSVQTTFNWWTPNGTVSLDWGPQKAPGRLSKQAGSLGQPEGDACKYFWMSNKEFDYDQVYCAVNQSVNDIGFGTGWLPPLSPTSRAVDIANGFDTRYVVSFGAFNLAPGDTLPVTLGYIAGAGFHTNPTNFSSNLGTSAANYLDTTRIRNYQKGLDFTALASNARWVQRVFDNETIVDTVLCGGQLVPRPHGDGIPDFKGPQPPPAPQITMASELGQVRIRWDGKETETAVDSFSKIIDFEGYRIWMSTDNQNFTLIGTYDKRDWKPSYFNAARNRWEPAPARPLTLPEIQQLYGSKWDTSGNLQIDPEKFNAATGTTPAALPAQDPTLTNPDVSKTAIRVRFSTNPVRDTIFYFTRQDYNIDLAGRKVYPAITDPNNDSSYWYEYTVSGLFPSLPYYFAVAPFDFGLLTPSQNLDPLEATPNSAARLAYALPSEQARQDGNLKVSVYPNPYRIDQDYSYFENPTQTGGAQYSQRLNFINLPAKCIIRIYTVDGDLVQEIKHDKSLAAADAGFDQWDLLTRNTQTVTAGLYLFTVLSTYGQDAGQVVHVGKIIIIK